MYLFLQWIRPEGTFEDNRKRMLDANVESMNCCRLWVENVQGPIGKESWLEIETNSSNFRVLPTATFEVKQIQSMVWVSR